MSDELDDDLGIDLDAWQAPPLPPGGVADGVLARMRQEVTSQVRTTPVEIVPSKRRWWIAGAAAAALTVSTVAIVAFGPWQGAMKRAPESGMGMVAATSPQHLAMGPSSAELDVGTFVSWEREQDRVKVRQPSGSATWRIDEDDTLTIDATVASIEARNASLRVEVQVIDKQTVATSAVTAAAIALVTVIVYDGTVRVTSEDKTVVVPAGKTYQVRANQNVFEEDVATIERLQQKIAELERQRRELLAAMDKDRDRTTKREGVFDPFAPEPDKLDLAVVTKCEELVEKGRYLIASGNPAPAVPMFEAAQQQCKPDGNTTRLLILAVCKSGNATKAKALAKQLPKSFHDLLLSTCANNNINLDFFDSDVAELGDLQVTSRPRARVLVDGKLVGETPVQMTLTPGKHKVTYVVGNDRHSFSVNVKPGKTVTLDKVLE